MAEGNEGRMAAAVEKLGNTFQIDTGQRWDLLRALQSRGEKAREELQEISQSLSKAGYQQGLLTAKIRQLREREQATPGGRD